jgi:hypothetical protein
MTNPERAFNVLPSSSHCHLPVCHHPLYVKPGHLGSLEKVARFHQTVGRLDLPEIPGRSEKAATGQVLSLAAFPCFGVCHDVASDLVFEEPIEK